MIRFLVGKIVVFSILYLYELGNGSSFEDFLTPLLNEFVRMLLNLLDSSRIMLSFLILHDFSVALQAFRLQDVSARLTIICREICMIL